MTFNILGSLCKRLCDSCTVDTICDCSKKALVIITDEETRGHILNLFTEVNKGLADLINTAEKKNIKAGKINVRKVDEKNASEQDKIMGIFAVAHKNLTDLNEAKGEMAEGWHRLSLACHMARIDIQLKFSQFEPLTPKELKELEKRVEEVKRYGSAAVVLWKEVRKHIEEWRKIDISGMSKKQLNFLRKSVKRGGDANLIKASFQEMSFELQAIFLEGAKMFSKKDLVKYRQFQPWGLKGSESSEFQRSPSRTGSGSRSSEEKDEKSDN